VKTHTKLRIAILNLANSLSIDNARTVVTTYRMHKADAEYLTKTELLFLVIAFDLTT
jgi:hypothetical protein